MPRKYPKWNRDTNKSWYNLPDTCEIIYSSNLAECSDICASYLQCEETSIVVGFDAEWPVSYEKGKEDKVAVVQICVEPTKCFIFQVSEMVRFPPMLKYLIEHENFIKVGVNVEGDVMKLCRNFGIVGEKAMRSCVNLGPLANSVLDKSDNWSMATLCKYLFEKEVAKGAKVRMSRWDRHPLSPGQLKYAALDAYLSLEIYQNLIELRGGV